MPLYLKYLFAHCLLVARCLFVVVYYVAYIILAMYYIIYRESIQYNTII